MSPIIVTRLSELGKPLYTRFARIGETYLHETPEVTVEGLLITDEVEANSVEGEIRHLDAAELSASKVTVATLLREAIGCSESQVAFIVIDYHMITNNFVEQM